MSSVKSYINIKNKYDRFIVLIDMDCFYCQVEEKLNPSLKDKPIAVVQYNPYKGGGIIAVNYTARAKGVTRHMRGDEAKSVCPEIELVSVLSSRGKADLTKYRTAGNEVAKILQMYSPVFERASIDEAYLDITDLVSKRLVDMNEGKFILQPDKLLNTIVFGYDGIGSFIANVSNFEPLDIDSDIDQGIFHKSNIQLLLAAAIVNEIRAKVREKTGFTCSAGICHNKILAKLTCGMNKPNKQTILPLKGIPILYKELPVNKIKGLGAKFGVTVCETLKIKFMGELRQYSEKQLQSKFDEKNGTWLHLLSKGIDLEAVLPRLVPKSIGSSKRFPGRNAITGLSTLNHWLNELSDELVERLNKDELENNRYAKQLTVSFTQEINGEDISSTRVFPLVAYNVERIAKDAGEIIEKNSEIFLRPGTTALTNPIKILGVSAAKFEDYKGEKSKNIEAFFSTAKKLKELSEGPSITPYKTITASPETGNNNKYSMKISKFFNNTKVPAILEYNENNEAVKEETKDEEEKPKLTQNLSSFISLIKTKPSSTITKPKILEVEDDSDEDLFEVEKPVEVASTSNPVEAAGSSRVFEVAGTSKASEVSGTSKEISDMKKEVDEFEVKEEKIEENFEVFQNEKENEDLQENLEVSENLLDKDLEVKKEESEETVIIEEFQGTYENQTAENTSASPKTSTELQEELNSEADEAQKIEDLENSIMRFEYESEDVAKPSNDSHKFDHGESSKKQSDFTMNYAEYHIPEINSILSEITEECEECGKRISPINRLEHMDMHLAFKLSQQLREEYRNELKITKPVASTTSKSKSNENVKKSSNSISKPITKVPSIINFFQKEKDEENDAEKIKCEQCNVFIRLDKIEEHNDFHYAKNILALEKSDNVKSEKSISPNGVNRNSKKRPLSVQGNSNNSAKHFKAFFQNK